MTYVTVTADPTGQQPMIEDRTEQPDDIIAALDRNRVEHGHTSLSLAKHLREVGTLRFETAYANYYIYSVNGEKKPTAKRLRLEVGKTYTTAGGTRVEITNMTDASTFLSACGNVFRNDGRFVNSAGGYLTIHDLIRQCPDTGPAMMNEQTRRVIATFEVDPPFIEAIMSSDRTDAKINKLAHDVIGMRGGTTTWGRGCTAANYNAIDRAAFAAHFVELYAIDKPKIDGNTDRGIKLVMGVKYTLRNGTIIEMFSGPHLGLLAERPPYFTSHHGTYEENGLYQRNDYTHEEAYDIIGVASNPTPTTKEPAPMKNLALNTITYLNGDDVSKLSDDTLIEQIRYAEAHLAHMAGIVNKPKKLQAKIDKLTADIATLVEYIDNRETK